MTESIQENEYLKIDSLLAYHYNILPYTLTDDQYAELYVGLDFIFKSKLNKTEL